MLVYRREGRVDIVVAVVHVAAVTALDCLFRIEACALSAVPPFARHGAVVDLPNFRQGPTAPTKGIGELR